MRIKGLKIHRITSWLLVLLSLITTILGYGVARRLVTPRDTYLLIHLVLDWIILGLGIIHVYFSWKYLKIKFSRIVAGLRSERANTVSALRLLQRITKWLIIIFAIITGVSALIYYNWYAVIFDDIFPFGWHLDFDVVLLIFVIIHVALGSKFFLTRKKIKHWKFDALIVLISSTLIITVISFNLPPQKPSYNIQIGNIKYNFSPSAINSSVRPDLFQNGSFSAFDVLVQLDFVGKINLTYHFNSSMDTHMIDSINGTQNWWYYIYYSGGNIEKNVVRMDHYLWKPGTMIFLYNEDPSYISHLYSTFEEEVTRLANNNGTVIIPEVIIDSETFYLEFFNVTVTAHNLRNDTLQNGVITALDIIMSLGDSGNISYVLEWIESLRGAFYVHSYFVDQINADKTVGRCGFLYEIGDNDFKNGPNYIFLASDERILTSPEYLLFFYGCL
ncbi:MAG: cytochrome b/b6 domain-containing protein [Promethearchaeota archaeon]|jgi:hypothetical protein